MTVHLCFEEYCSGRNINSNATIDQMRLSFMEVNFVCRSSTPCGIFQASKSITPITVTNCSRKLCFIPTMEDKWKRVKRTYVMNEERLLKSSTFATELKIFLTTETWLEAEAIAIPKGREAFFDNILRRFISLDLVDTIKYISMRSHKKQAMITHLNAKLEVLLSSVSVLYLLMIM